MRWLKLFSGLWTVVSVGLSGRKIWKIGVLEGSDQGTMSIASALWGNGVQELCKQAGSRERAKCSPCQQMDCLIKPMTTSNSSGPGACACFSQRRSHAASMIFRLFSCRGKFPIGFKRDPLSLLHPCLGMPHGSLCSVAVTLAVISIAIGECLCPSVSLKVSWELERLPEGFSGQLWVKWVMGCAAFSVSFHWSEHFHILHAWL